MPQSNNGPSREPTPQELAQEIGSPHWTPLCGWIEANYDTRPLIQFSGCTMAHGWNMKYRKGSRALCTLYPGQGMFTCLVSVGRKETPAAELLLPTFTPYTQALWARTALYNGGRWLMVEVTDGDILEDVKTLISLRAKPGKKTSASR